MIIRITKTTDPFARIPKTVLNDKRLSWRAKGILSYLLGKPKDWIVQTNDVINHSTEGRDAVRAAFKELQQCGYAVLINTGNGREWLVADRPRNPCPENPSLDPCPEKANMVKSATTKNDKETKNDLAPFGSPEFETAWAEWVNHRKHKRASLTPEAIKRQRAKLAAMGETRAIAAINFSIEQGYTGIFEPTQNNGTNQRNSTKGGRVNRNIGTINEGKSGRYAGVGKVR
jgi:hypothetical protein